MLRIAYHQNYVQPLPAGHRFPMEKYDLLPKQLVYEGTVEEDAFFSPEPIENKWVLLTHTENYFRRLISLELSPREQRVSGFPHDEKLIQRELQIMEGTRRCATFALKHGVAMNIAGGTHHAFTKKAEGFCLLNDIAIASNWLLNENKASKILIIDLDVHQGNGTAQIFKDNPNVFTFSMHGKNNYPLHKEKSDVDVALNDGIGDKEYLYALEKELDFILSRFQPEFIFYQSGVDVLETDKLGKLGVSINGCKRRDEIVLSIAKQNRIPIVASMGGGYSPEIKHIIEAHANTFRTAQYIYF